MKENQKENWGLFCLLFISDYWKLIDTHNSCPLTLVLVWKSCYFYALDPLFYQLASTLQIDSQKCCLIVRCDSSSFFFLVTPWNINDDWRMHLLIDCLDDLLSSSDQWKVEVTDNLFSVFSLCWLGIDNYPSQMCKSRVFDISVAMS